MPRVRDSVPALGLALACTPGGSGAGPSGPHIGVWNLVARHDLSEQGRVTTPFPALRERTQGELVYCEGEFQNLEILESGVAFVTYGSVYGYGAACHEQLEYSERVPYNWAQLDDGRVGLYYDHSSGGDETGGDIPWQELVVICQVEGQRLECVDPELGSAGAGTDFARPACEGDAACVGNERCFAGQCVAPAPG